MPQKTEILSNIGQTLERYKFTYLSSCVDSQHHVKFVGSKRDVSATIVANSDTLACAVVTALLTRDDVTIPVVVVESNEANVSSAESNLVATVVPPVGKSGVASTVSEGNHAVDLAPTVLTDPSVTAALVLVDRRRDDVAAAVHWGSSLSIVEVERAHQLWPAVRMGQHESNSTLVLFRLFVGKDGSTSTVTSLVVVVVNEGKRVARSKKTPSSSPVMKPSKLVSTVESSAEFHTEFELCDGSKRSVFIAGNDFTTKINNFLVDVWASARGETVISVEVV
ncbi:hypothetical protein HW555_011093 [Spodoptera exigua]|uniref:Uncharacterized protein n=1 Tax=Spodoptera exigua TaxID=7107 RepID=A0A835KZ68_SPOEX|nr:hypothetical protein HW555_011093 [Spodoptera exigua]